MRVKIERLTEGKNVEGFTEGESLVPGETERERTLIHIHTHTTRPHTQVLMQENSHIHTNIHTFLSLYTIYSTICLYNSISISNNLSIYQFIYSYTYLSLSINTYQPIYLSTSIINQSTYIYQSVCLSISLN